MSPQLELALVWCLFHSDDTFLCAGDSQDPVPAPQPSLHQAPAPTYREGLSDCSPLPPGQAGLALAMKVSQKHTKDLPAQGLSHSYGIQWSALKGAWNHMEWSRDTMNLMRYCRCGSRAVPRKA